MKNAVTAGIKRDSSDSNPETKRAGRGDRFQKRRVDQRTLRKSVSLDMKPPMTEVSTV